MPERLEKLAYITSVRSYEHTMYNYTHTHKLISASTFRGVFFHVRTCAWSVVVVCVRVCACVCVSSVCFSLYL